MKTPSEIQGAKNLQYIAAQGWKTLAEIQATEASKTERKKNRREYTLHAQNSQLWAAGPMDARPAYIKFIHGARWFRMCYKTQTNHTSRLALENKRRHTETIENGRTRRETNRAGIILPF